MAKASSKFHASSGISQSSSGHGGAASTQANDRRKQPDVCAVKESMTKVTADVIICPIHGLLKYHLRYKNDQPTLAYQIINSQPPIKTFIEETKKTLSGLAAGQVLLYNTPKLPKGGRSVIFATGPKKRDYTNIEECYTDLRCTFMNCFETVAGMNAKVLAVPAISAGNGGVDGGKVIEILVETLADFLAWYQLHPLKSGNTLETIMFVTLDEHMKKLFESEWKKAMSSAAVNSLATSKPTSVKSSATSKPTSVKSSATSKPTSVKSSATSKPNSPTINPSSSVVNSSGASGSSGTSGSNSSNFKRPCIHDNGGSSMGLNPTSPLSGAGDLGTGWRGNTRSRGALASLATDSSIEIDDNTDEESEMVVDHEPVNRADQSEEKCPICLEDIETGMKTKIPGCKHVLCTDCFAECNQRSPICPVCKKAFGPITGNQPEDASMDISRYPQHLAGYVRCGMIVIEYCVKNGIQTRDHPNPGQPYQGTVRHAYLPDNIEGQKVLKLLERAFKRRLIFTIGSSVTTGRDNIVTWNDIHHKTNISGGPTNYGYPDDSYLSRVTADLAAKGIV